MGTNPIRGCPADTEASGDLRTVIGRIGKQSPDVGDLLRRQLGAGTELDAVGLGAGDAVGSTVFDQVALEFTDGGQHVEQQAASRTRCVDGLVEHDEVDLLGLDLLRDLGEVEDGTSETVEPRDDELVAVADKFESRFQLKALGAGAA